MKWCLPLTVQPLYTLQAGSPHCTALNSAQLLLSSSPGRTRRIYRPARSRDLPHFTGSAHTPYTYLCTRPHRIQPPAVHNHPVVHKSQIVSHLSCAQPKYVYLPRGNRTYDPLRNRRLALTTTCCTNSTDVFLAVPLSHITRIIITAVLLWFRSACVREVFGSGSASCDRMVGDSVICCS